MKASEKVATLLRTDGTRMEISPANGRDFKLDELTELLQCEYIEIVYLSESHIMVIDEEGKLHSPPSPLNLMATAHAHLLGRIAKDDCIVGRAIVCRKGMVK